MERFLSWLDSDKLTEKDKSELKGIESDDDEIKERFSDYLSFGTAGLRGVMAMGTQPLFIPPQKIMSSPTERFPVRDLRRSAGIRRSS